MNRGNLIVFEGIHGTGKSKVCLEMAKALPKTKLIKIQDNKGLVGTLVNKTISNANIENKNALYLILLANVWEVQKEIIKWIGEGYNVICDTYCYSINAYNVANGLDYEWCEKMICGLVEPDLIILLNASMDVLKDRVVSAETTDEFWMLQENANAVFHKMMNEKWKTIDTDQRINLVISNVGYLIYKTLRKAYNDIEYIK